MGLTRGVCVRKQPTPKLVISDLQPTKDGDGSNCIGSFGGVFLSKDSNSNTSLTSSNSALRPCQTTQCILVSESSGASEVESVPKDETRKHSSVLAIYPNPVSRMATFSFTASEDTKCTISISNAEGRMLKTYSLTAEAEVSQRFSTDLADLPNGTYYCRVTSGGNVIAGKFIVAK